MFFKNLLLTPLLAAGLTSALPQPVATESSSCPSSDVQAFGLLALRSASDIHFSSFNAAKSSIFLKLPDQGASCDKDSDGTATFYLQDGGLYLYSTENPPQQIFVDRSGMGMFSYHISFLNSDNNPLLGQGKLGYITGAQSPPRNGELTGWTLDENDDLTLDGASFIACPNSIEGSWSVWVSAGVAQPAGNSGCLGLSARASFITEPNSCLYTE